jgi:hypothetical protein
LCVRGEDAKSDEGGVLVEWPVAAVLVVVCGRVGRK